MLFSVPNRFACPLPPGEAKRINDMHIPKTFRKAANYTDFTENGYILIKK